MRGRASLLKVSCISILLVFVITVAGDPIIDAVYPHHECCDICDKLAGGYGVIVANPEPSLPHLAIQHASLNIVTYQAESCLDCSVHLARAPPAN